MARRVSERAPAGYTADSRALAKWLAQPIVSDRPPRILGLQDALNQVLPLLTGKDGAPLDHERLVGLVLDRRGYPVATEILTVGSYSATILDPPHILRWALTRDRVVRSIILAHNHPSGDPEPSVEDQLATRKMMAGCAAVGLVLHDHIVVGGGCWVSMTERGLV